MKAYKWLFPSVASDSILNVLTLLNAFKTTNEQNLLIKFILSFQ